MKPNREIAIKFIHLYGKYFMGGASDRSNIADVILERLSRLVDDHSELHNNYAFPTKEKVDRIVRECGWDSVLDPYEAFFDEDGRILKDYDPLYSSYVDIFLKDNGKDTCTSCTLKEGLDILFNNNNCPMSEKNFYYQRQIKNNILHYCTLIGVESPTLTKRVFLSNEPFSKLVLQETAIELGIPTRLLFLGVVDMGCTNDLKLFSNPIYGFGEQVVLRSFRGWLHSKDLNTCSYQEQFKLFFEKTGHMGWRMLEDSTESGCLSKGVFYSKEFRGLCQLYKNPVPPTKVVFKNSELSDYNGIGEFKEKISTLASSLLENWEDSLCMVAPGVDPGYFKISSHGEDKYIYVNLEESIELYLAKVMSEKVAYKIKNMPLEERLAIVAEDKHYLNVEIAEYINRTTSNWDYDNIVISSYGINRSLKNMIPIKGATIPRLDNNIALSRRKGSSSLKIYETCGLPLSEHINMGDNRVFFYLTNIRRKQTLFIYSTYNELNRTIGRYFNKYMGYRKFPIDAFILNNIYT